MEMLTVKKRILCDVESQEDLIRQKSFSFLKKCFKKANNNFRFFRCNLHRK